MNMKLRITTILSAAVVVGVPLAAAMAQDVEINARAGQERFWNIPGWRTIAYKTVSGGTDTDRIYAPGRQRYARLRLCSLNAPIRLRDFDVHYANGQREDVRTRDRLGPGSCTGAIDLRGGRRDITMIRLKYGRIDRSMRRPLIRVLAR
jgi:hypothetical protein